MNAEKKQWKELLSEKEELINILKILVEFDEKTGRWSRYGSPELHLMRKAVSLSHSENIRIFIQSLGGFVYYVVAELKSVGGFLSTAWIHEDGIRAERDIYSENDSHPVHGILCLTDLYERSCAVVPLDAPEICLAAPTLDIMQEHMIQR